MKHAGARHPARAGDAVPGGSARSALLLERRDAEKIERRLEDKLRRLRHKALLLAAVRAENEIIRENIDELMKENARLQEAVVTMNPLQLLSPGTGHA